MMLSYHRCLLYRWVTSFAAVLLMCFSGCRSGFVDRQQGGFGSPGKSAQASASRTQARFVDVAASAGISYRFHLPGSTPRNILQTIGNGCAFLDYNNDGNLDILLVGDPPALYAGDGHGHFRDVTHETGLDKLHGHFLGCAVGDYDNDGFADIYLSAYRGGALLHNEEGSPHPLSPSPYHPAAQVGEGGLRSSSSTRIRLDYRSPSPQRGTSDRGRGGQGMRAIRVFRDVTKEAGIKPQAWGTSCTFADVDGDGRLDLYIGNYVRFGTDTIPQLCPAENGVLTVCHPYHYDPLKGALYHNLGDGKFEDVTQAWGAQNVHGNALGVTAADYNGFGHPSIAIADDELPGDLLQYRNGKMDNVGVSSGIAYSADGSTHAGMGLDWGDYNNDGKLDLAITTFEVQIKPIYRQEANGNFNDQATALGIGLATLKYLSFGIKWLDYDNDGWLDLMITNGHIADNVADYLPDHSFRQPTLLFHNEGGQHFTEVSGLAGPDLQRPIVGRGLAIGDFDNDGRMDTLVVDSDGTPLLLHNESAPVGHWLELNLVGVRSNRDGIGAIVTADTEGLRVTRLCHTDGSYFSASDKRVHIGLGPAAAVQTLTVRWPSGHIDVYKNVAADRILTIREGAPDLQSFHAG